MNRNELEPSTRRSGGCILVLVLLIAALLVTAVMGWGPFSSDRYEKTLYQAQGNSLIQIIKGVGYSLANAARTLVAGAKSFFGATEYRMLGGIQNSADGAKGMGRSISKPFRFGK